MPVLKNLSNTLFGWISPRATHENRVTKQFKSPDLKSPASIAVAKRRARQVAEGKLQSATGNVPRHRKTRNSGEIPWENEPPSSPALLETVESALATTAIYDDDEMEDAGDEGAVDTMSDDDDSGLIEEDEERSENDDRSESVEVKEEQTSGSEDGSRNSQQDDDDEDEQKAEVEDIFDANQGTHVVDLAEDHEAALEAATRQLEIDREAKFEEQKAEAITMLRDGWNMDTIDLYMLLDRRTLETLLPIDWNMDFPLFPWSIFTHEYSQAFLGGTRPEQDFIMIKATSAILKLPVHIRNQIRIKAWYGRRAEAMVVKYCEDYMKFIHRDCKLWIPIKKKKMWSLICYAPGDEKTSTDKLEEMILVRLRKRASKVLDLLRVDAREPAIGKRDKSEFFWHEGTGYLCEPPTLYGIVAKEAVIALVAYEPLSPRDALRTLAFFHMSKAKYDVWNALALAIVMVHCRNHLLKIKKLIPEDLDSLVLSDSDPDL
jgi:hypothetical protein